MALVQNQYFRRMSHCRMSMVSAMSMGSFAEDDLFDGEELVDVFHPEKCESAPDAPVSSFEMPIPVVSSSDDSNDYEMVTGEDLADAFEEFPDIALDEEDVVLEPNVIEDLPNDEYIADLQPFDILCGRYLSGAKHCIGNRRFRVIVMMNLPSYQSAETRDARAGVITTIFTTMEECGARFLRKTDRPNVYSRLTKKQIREKIGHTFRDMMSMSE